MRSSFSSSFVDALITPTPTDATRVDNIEAPANDGFKEEAADRTRGPTGSCTPSLQRTEEVVCPHYYHIAQQTSIRATDK